MRLSKHQREQHKGAARDLIERIEDRLQPSARLKRCGANDPASIAQKVSACKTRLHKGPKDKELVNINLELADLFYLTSNAARRAPRSKPPTTRVH